MKTPFKTALKTVFQPQGGSTTSKAVEPEPALCLLPGAAVEPSPRRFNRSPVSGGRRPCLLCTARWGREKGVGVWLRGSKVSLVLFPLLSLLIHLTLFSFFFLFPTIGDLAPSPCASDPGTCAQGTSSWWWGGLFPRGPPSSFQVWASPLRGNSLF